MNYVPNLSLGLNSSLLPLLMRFKPSVVIETMSDKYEIIEDTSRTSTQ